MYKTIDSVRGKRYLHNGRLVKKADVPEDILLELEDHATVEEAHERTDKSCVFCGAESNFSRFINLKTIYMCGNDYYAKTVGEIVQRLNQLEGEQNG